MNKKTKIYLTLIVSIIVISFLIIENKEYIQKKYYTMKCDGSFAYKSKKDKEENCYKLANLYYQENPFKAFDLYDRLCPSFSDACNKLGVMYIKGYGVKQNSLVGIFILQLACDNNNAMACNNLGKISLYKLKNLLLKHTDSSSDSSKIEKLKASILKDFKKACNLKLQEGCDNYRKIKIGNNILE